MQQFQQIIEQAWEDRATLQPGTAPAKIGEAVGAVLAELDAGRLRVAEKINGEWVVHQWLKKAVLLSFKLNDNKPIESCDLRFYDKVDTKFTGWTDEQFKQAGVRVVPPAVARKGSFQAKNVARITNSDLLNCFFIGKILKLIDLLVTTANLLLLSLESC